MKLLVIAAAALAATPVPAAPGSASSALQATSATNLIVLGNITGGHHLEDTTFVGGNIGGSFNSDVTPQSPLKKLPKSNHDELT